MAYTRPTFMRKLLIFITLAVSLVQAQTIHNGEDVLRAMHARYASSWYQNVTFVLLKNGAPVARLVPDGERVCLGRDLARVLRKVELPVDEAVAWNRDLKKARRRLKPQPDKWR